MGGGLQGEREDYGFFETLRHVENLLNYGLCQQNNYLIGGLEHVFSIYWE